MESQDSASPKTEPVVPAPSQKPGPATAGMGARMRSWLLVMGLAMLAGLGLADR